ncbi:NADH-quinone oxidoreductase subunit J family protein [Buchnera aphidicola]|uniref:NADH-quinone oxidoreductase subunit J n=1 Tax=Buchnera aphidicola subsp. Tuberolachnus salignus TaxID=98804 RepID=A0A160SYT7_BUCTT|nr:NADH-quinone oxidoreductase subunit J [Buchnera aphidicola]CUR53096.1 NADH-quinone oxidoreductase subunit J [Buchnera aphidicola (Tuberolachnus salignus)]
MNYLFYLLSFLAIFFTFLSIFTINSIYALLYFILSLFSISGFFFLFGTHFIGALEVIIYSGAIMVLFLFIIMLINIKKEKKIEIFSKKNFLYHIIFMCLFGFFISVYSYMFFTYWNKNIIFKQYNLKNIGIFLFRDHVFIVELASLILFTAIILVYFFINLYKKNNNY